MIVCICIQKKGNECCSWKLWDGHEKRKPLLINHQFLFEYLCSAVRLVPCRERGSSPCYILNLTVARASRGRWCVLIIPCSASAFQLNTSLIPCPVILLLPTDGREPVLHRSGEIRVYENTINAVNREAGLEVWSQSCILQSFTQNCSKVNKTFPRIKSVGFDANLERPILPVPSDCNAH